MGAKEKGERIEPRVGQRWADNDKRNFGKDGKPTREVVIREIRTVFVPGPAQASCDVYIDGAKTRSTVIRLDRFRPTATGYRYVGEGPPGQGGGTIDA